MFAFEFAVLTVSSLSTATRYTLSLREARIIVKQTADRREQIRQERQAIRSSNSQGNNSTPSAEPLSGAHTEDDIDALDIDVPGWEEKGRWVFYLDLATGRSEALHPISPYTKAFDQTFANCFFT